MLQADILTFSSPYDMRVYDSVFPQQMESVLVSVNVFVFSWYSY